MLLITPLMGVVLIYVLESQVLLLNLSRQMQGEATLIADIARDSPQIWTTVDQAQAFVARYNRDVTAQLMLLQPDGRIWASDESEIPSQQEKVITHPGLAEVRQGKISVITAYSQDQQAEIADVVAPVIDSQGEVVGVVRLTRELATVYQRFLRLRFFIAWVLIPGLLLGLLIGLILAITLERPLHQLAKTVQETTRMDELGPIPEQGPQEIQLVARAINTMGERLRLLELTRSRLMTNLVHELARPLAAMRAAVHALQLGAIADEKFRTYLLSGMVAELQGLQRLLDELLQFYELSVGEAQLNRRATAIGEWLAISLSTWQEAAEEKGLVWRTEIPAELPTLPIDPDRLGQALGNLLSNAIKYTPTGGTVSVAAAVDTEYLRLRVSDTGPGVDPSEQAHVFEPFYRMESSRHSAKGLGLGLAIVHDIVLAHGGEITIESSPGHGSHFTIQLPLQSGTGWILPSQAAPQI
jgi:signal transduction histidine kinase